MLGRSGSAWGAGGWVGRSYFHIYGVVIVLIVTYFQTKSNINSQGLLAFLHSLYSAESILGRQGRDAKQRWSKLKSSFSGPQFRKLTLTIPLALHQLSSSNHSALSVYSYYDLLTNNLIINNAKEWPTKATIWSKTPEGTILQTQCTTNESKSISFYSYRRYLATLFK